MPESERWLHEKEKGATAHWATHDLLSVLGGAAAACGVIALWAMNINVWLAVAGSVVGFLIVTAGYLYPVMRYLQRVREAGGAAPALASTNPLKHMLLGACLSGVALLGT